MLNLAEIGIDFLGIALALAGIDDDDLDHGGISCFVASGEPWADVRRYPRKGGQQRIIVPTQSEDTL